MQRDVEAVKVESSKLSMISRASQLKYISKGDELVVRGLVHSTSSIRK